MLIQKLLPVTYWLVALSISLFAAVRGGRDERIGCAILLIGSLASVLVVWGVPVQARVSLIQRGVFVVDVVTLAAFVALALRTERFWPLWATAFHLVAVATHAAHFADARIVPRAYVLAQGMWAYPMWITILLGSLARSRCSTARSIVSPGRSTKP